MKNIIVLGLVFLILSCRSIKKQDYELDNKIKENIHFAYFEPIEYTFRNKAGSELYIHKFNLTENEIAIIGSWYIYNLDQNYGKKDGPGIEISFLPNRRLVIFQNGYNRNNENYYIVGNWKIKRNGVYCNLEYRINNKINEIEELKFSKVFIKIFTIEKYIYAYVNRKPFEFNNFDINIKEYLLIDDIDNPRYRGIQDELSCSWDRMDDRNELGYFLLNNDIIKKDEVLELCNLLYK